MGSPCNDMRSDDSVSGRLGTFSTKAKYVGKSFIRIPTIGCSDLLNQVYGSFTGSLGTPFMLPKFYMQSNVLCVRHRKQEIM